MAQIIIVSDLDGSLLDAGTYSFREAEPALRRIAIKRLPLVLCSSKTRTEIEVYRDRLHNRDPFISENGGGIFLPDGPVPRHENERTIGGYRAIVLGRPYQEIRSAFTRLRDRLGISATGFGDLNVREIAELTGLPPEEAVLAAARDFGEPFFFGEGERRQEAFLQAILESGYRWTQGRFYHVTGENDKGKAVLVLKELFARLYGSIITVGLGDGFNDRPMLEQVDHPVLIRRPDGSHDPRVDLPDLLRTNGVGPAGWNEGVMRTLDELE